MSNLHIIENAYYMGMEAYRLHGIPLARIENELRLQLPTTVRAPFATTSHVQKQITFFLNDPNVGLRQVLMALEELDAEDVKVTERPDFKEAQVTCKVEKIYKIDITIFLSGNKNCEYVEVGKKEVPIYELKCNEEG